MLVQFSDNAVAFHTDGGIVIGADEKAIKNIVETLPT